MKVVLVGLPYFAKKLATSLAEADPASEYLSIDVEAGLKAKLSFLWHILSANVLYSIGGHVKGGKVLNIAMWLHKRIVMHWVGTDVLMAGKAAADGGVDQKLVKATRHLCEVAWIQEELRPIGIFAELADIAVFPDDLPEPAPLPGRFSILTYMSKGRERFYGLDWVIEVAMAFPSVEIRIAGISEYSEGLPENIRLLGWVADMSAEYRNCVMYLRLPAHDGLAFSVLEAMSTGRYVAYTEPLACTLQVNSVADLIHKVKEVFEAYSEGNLQANLAGYDYVRTHHSRNDVMRPLVDILLNKATASCEGGCI